MQIRRATEREAHDCATIYNHYVEHSTATFDLVPRDAARTRSWYDAHRDAAWPLLVAADPQAAVLGWGTLTPWSDRPAYRHTGEISIFVSPDALRRGAGLALGQALLEHGRRHQLRTLLARLEYSNEPSRRLFARLGFSDVGIMHAVGHKFGRWLDVLVMETDLHA